MKAIHAPIRISFAWAGLIMCIIWSAKLLGVISDPPPQGVTTRQQLGEILATQCTAAMARDSQQVEELLQAMREHNTDICSLTLLDLSGEVLVQVGGAERRQANTLQIPWYRHGRPGGHLLVEFTSATEPRGGGLISWQTVRLMGFVGGLAWLASVLYLPRVLQQLDLSKVIPEQVRATLDAFAEGLIVLDREQRIVHVNHMFSRAVGVDPDQLRGKYVADLPWNVQDDQDGAEQPWARAIRERQVRSGETVQFCDDGHAKRTYSVNAAPIIDDKGICHGALVSLDDVTEMEQRNTALKLMLTKLEESRERIRRQNRELLHLATRDPLTSCLNRRAFFEAFEKAFHSHSVRSRHLACILLDIDHFKNINDVYGHGVGDEVLKGISQVIRDGVRDADHVCRYGGEEFCVAFPEANLEAAMQHAEGIRRAIAASTIGGVSLTASIGVSSLELRPADPQKMIQQADEALYAAKRNGRNQVVAYHQMPTPKLPSDVDLARPSEGIDVHIPFHVVNALFAALSFRDIRTAEHCRRVADSCVYVAESVMAPSDVYLLEVAALLHEVGKLGVPDSILFKPEELTDKERDMVRMHERVGLELLQTTLACEPLTAILECRLGGLDAMSGSFGMPEHRQALCLAGKILVIADAYDAMTTDQVYRQALTREDAFAELRRCAGRQFDSGQVERFIRSLQARDTSLQPTGAERYASRLSPLTAAAFSTSAVP